MSCSSHSCILYCALVLALIGHEVVSDTDPTDHIGGGTASHLMHFSPSILEDLATRDRDEKVMKIVTPAALPSGYIVNKPGNPDRVGSVLNAYQNKDKDVSETDLYLLGAIEKLVYRVDLMDKRLRRTEELLQYVMQHGNQDREDPCPANFTRIAKNCYHMSDRQLNWKSAMSMCKSLGGNLVEFESKEEFLEVITFLLADKHYRGNDFWTGGLNPGLLWIWANSAKPVSGTKESGSRPEDTIPGAGRCLKLAYNGSNKVFAYSGADCSMRQKYVCEHEENTTERALSRIHKSLTLNQAAEPPVDF